MRVLVVDDDGERAAVVKDSLRESGAEIAAVIGIDADLRAAIQVHRPDVIIVDLASPYRDYLEDLMSINRETPRPIALLVGEEDRPLMARAVRAGVSIYAVDGLSAKLVRSIMETVSGHFHRFQTVNEELEKSRAALNDRKIVERAKGLLMAHRDLSEDQAYKTLRRMAMDQNRRLVEVAEAVLNVADLLKR
ncbi:response regulator NasT [Azospirillum agricola]|uniref:ANTAR domain-containing response regulator n=1 Tax=Azospirillum agricola TaxID=1720247 RepID=UPI001AE2A341|nr:ANTAR domain-containing protein [Azospirillum agricola]MBP2232125.1 response regulator NasT [Azospirillum agricola]